MNLDALMQTWGPRVFKSEHIFTWTERETLAYLAWKANESQLVAEFGAYMGRSASVMLDAKCGHLWSCDPFMVDGTFECASYFLREHIAAGRCEIIRKRSREAADQLSHVRGKLDLVFVDDGHGYDDVVLDINTWLPMLRSGGLLCGHDYETSPENDVTRAVKELLPGHSNPLQRLWAYVKP